MSVQERGPWDDFKPQASADDDGPWSAWQKPAAPPPAPEKPGLIRSLADIALEVPAGAANASKALADAFGASNAVSQGFGSFAEGAQSLQSPARQAERQQQAQRALAAEQTGSTWEEVKAAGQNFLESPVSATANAAGSLVPVIAGGLIASRFGIKPTAATGTIGAGMGAGAVKGSIYDDQVKRAQAAGLTPEQAQAQATAAQAYSGPNTDQIALGAGLGVLAGTTGVERMLGGGASAIKNRAGRTLAGMATEAVPEAVQGGQERLAANIAAQREGYEAPTWQGVAGQATMEGLASTGPGGLSGFMTPHVDPNAGPLSRAAATAQETGAAGLAQAAQQANAAAGNATEAGKDADPLKAFNEALRVVRTREGKQAADELLYAFNVARNPQADEVMRSRAAQYVQSVVGRLEAERAEAQARIQRPKPDVPPAGSFSDMNEFADFIAQERADLEQRRNPQPFAEMTGVDAGFDPMNRARNQVPPPSGSFGQMNEFADLLAQERADVTQRRDAIAERQAMEGESHLESIQGAIEGNRQAQSAQERMGLLDSILNDPETRNPLPRFESALKKAGYQQRRATPEERQAIERFQSASEAFAQPDTEPSAPNEMDASAMGIRERQPKVRQPQQAPAEKPQRAAFPMTREGAERRAAEQSQATGQAFEVVPHPSVKGRFAVQAVAEGRSSGLAGQSLASADQADAGALPRTEIAQSDRQDQPAAQDQRMPLPSGDMPQLGQRTSERTAELDRRNPQLAPARNQFPTASDSSSLDTSTANDSAGIATQQPTNALLNSGEIGTQGTDNGTPSAQALAPTQERGTAQQAETVAEQVRDATQREAAVADRAEPVLDLNKRPTGWKQVDYPNGDGVLLISADGKKAINFPSRNAKSGTEALRAQAKAQAFAIDNPHSSDTPKGELVVKPIFETSAKQEAANAAQPQPLEQAQGQASRPQGTPQGGATQSGQGVGGFVTTRTVYGDTVHVRQSDLDGDRALIPMFSADGKPKFKSVHRENLDADGSKQAAQNAEAGSLDDVVTAKNGTAFASKLAARREQNRRGFSESHDIVAGDEVQAGLGGFVLKRKPRSDLDTVAERVTEPTHADPGQKPEAATAPVIREAIQKSARNTPFDAKQAKAWLLGEIDRAIANVPPANRDMAADLAQEKARKFKLSDRVAKLAKGSIRDKLEREEGAAFDAMQADRIAKTAQQIGFVTFDVPGDGKFKVVNTVEAIEAFRDKVKASPGFRDNPTVRPSYGTGTAQGDNLEQSIADAKKFGTTDDALQEIGNAIEIARLKKAKDEDKLLDRFREASGGKDYDAWRAEQEAEGEIARREAGQSEQADSAATPATQAKQADKAPDIATPPVSETASPVGEEAGREGRSVISDAGEKIGGARKDRWKDRGMDIADLDEMTEAEGAELVTKANVWKPDYEAISERAEPVTAAMVKIVYDGLAAKPKDNTPEGRRRFVKAMQAVRKVYDNLDGPEAVKNAYQDLRRELGVSASSGMIQSEKEKEARAVMFSVYKGRSDPFVFVYQDLQRAKKMVEQGFPSIDPWKKRLLLRKDGGAGLTDRGVELHIAGSAEVGTPMTAEQLRAGFYRVITNDSKTVAYAATKEDAEAAARTIYERDMKGKGKDGKEEPSRPHLDELTRKGLPNRIDRDVTPEDFINTLGFRGIEFGNWSAQDERQRIINMAYDGLLDLAEIMGVPPKALSLNGSMGLAFGARGGGKFLAHYEPGKLVINMTKLRGGGSLAHEWAHALDHYFGELDRADAYTTQARGASGWYEMDDYSGQPRTRHEKVDGKWVAVSKRRLENLRPEMAEAFDGVMRAIFRKQIGKAEMVRSAELDIERAQSELASEERDNYRDYLTRRIASLKENLAELRNEPDDKTYSQGNSDYATEAGKLSGKSKNGYWSRPTEMFARAFESWVFDRVTAMGASSDYLVHGVEDGRFAGGEYKGNPYPSGKERADINAAFEKLARTMKTRETDKGVALFSRDTTSTGTTPDAIWQAVESLVGPIRRRRIVVVQSADELVAQGILTAEQARGAQAFVKDGKAYFIADAIQPGNERAVFLHEVGAHLGLEKILPPLQRKMLLNRIKTWAAQNDGSQESRIAKAALRRVEAAGGQDAESELLAYFVEEAVKAGINPTTGTAGPIGQWFKTLWNGIRAALQKLGLLSADRLTAQDIVNLAHGAAGVAMEAETESGTQFSRADQVDSPAFRKWFGESVVTDNGKPMSEGGKPLVVYHGTSGDFSAFSKSEDGGYHFGVVKAANQRLVDMGAEGLADAPNVIPAYLSIKNPARMPDMGNNWRAHIEAMKRHGHDGIVYENQFESPGHDSYIAFSPNQIKSATGNNGNFDPSDARIQFSRAASNVAPDTEAVSSKARDFLADVMKRPGTFGLLSRTLQTQYHKATKNPQFKAVWTRANAMFMDASRAMSRPAALAPELLPKFDVGNMGDAAKAFLFGKGKVANADMKAVADVLSAGTLAGGPGPMSGVRWGAQQMRDGIQVGERLVKLTDAQIKLYEQARAAIDASLDESAAAEAWKLLRRHTTDASLRDWIAQNPQDAPGVVADTLATVIEQETEKLDDLSLAATETPSKQADKAVAEQERIVADLKDTEERTAAIFDKAKTLKDAGYMPLMRFGQFRIAVTSQGDKGEKIEYVSRYESVLEANRARRQLMQDFPASEGFTVGAVEVTDQDAWKQFKGVSPETVMLFAKESGIDADEVMQTWYKEAVASRSSLRRMVHRKGYQGFSDDLPRVLASFITSNGKAAGYAYHLADMQQMMQDETMPGDVHREARELLETITQPTEKGANVRGVMASWYLLGSIASAIVNSTQVATMSLPFLSQFGSKGFAPGEAMAHLARAYPQAFGKIKDKALADAVKRAEEAGIVDSNEVFHLYAEAMKPMIAKLGSGSVAYRARAFMTLWGAPFAIVEKLNRKSTFIAAYTMAKAQGKTDAQAFDFGERAVTETQGIYAVHNRPNWARGAVGGAILTFRQFSIAYLELAARMWQSGPEGKKAAGLMIGILFLTAGLSGLPGEDDLLDILDTFSQTFLGKSTVSKMELRNWLNDTMGKELGAFVNSGVSAFLPLDVSGRMGMGNLLPGTALFKPSEPDPKREMLEVLGVPGSFAMSAIEGAKLAMQGEGTAAIKAFAPKAVQDVVKGAEMLRTGEARDLRGRKIVDVGVADAFWQSIGFNPSVKAEAGRRAFEVNEMIGYNKRKESEIVGRLARGVADRDQDAIQSAQQDLAEWNQRNPETPILINRRQVQQRIMQLQMERSGRIVKMAPPELRRRVSEALEEE